jgi:L,D-peptidoglycan transpeptidase YkuD (ErfK/YbiS/YcfS/YnhG family)
VLALSLVATSAGPATSAGDPDARPRHHPSRLAHVDGADQVVVVTSKRWSAATAVLRAYDRSPDGGWRLRMGPVPAHLGRNGFVPAAERRQGSRTTPAGTFGIRWAFGSAADPGTALRYRRTDGNDWWPYDPRDPATYNVFQPRRSRDSGWRRSWAEDLWTYGRQYRHVAVLDFNLPGAVRRVGGERVASRPADTRRGGGIFLHVNRAARDKATTGCVSVTPTRMAALLRWLDPAADPVLVMGPRSAITGL